MQNVYGYVWGIWRWRITGARINVNAYRTNVCDLPQAGRSVAELLQQGAKLAYEKGTQHGIPAEFPVDIVEAGKTCHRRSPLIHIHRWNGYVTTESICMLDDVGFISSPEFCYLQICGGVRTIIHEDVRPWQLEVVLIELGCELCGTYSKRSTKRGYVTRKHPLSSTSKLLVFMGRMLFEYGTCKMKEAIVWVLDNMHSPMETTLYLMLCLPSTMGGMQLPRPYGNYELSVPSYLWQKTAKRHIYPDLFWPEVGLMVEYDSDEIHAGKEKDDQERRELVQEMGYKVVTFRLEDLEDLKKFEAKASSVARYLGRALPPDSETFRTLQKTLRDMLVYHPRWI